MYFLHVIAIRLIRGNHEQSSNSAEIQSIVTRMSDGPAWHLGCTCSGGARDTGDDNITSCSRFLVAVVRTATGNKATQSSHAASPLFFASSSKTLQTTFSRSALQLDTRLTRRYFQASPH